MHFDGMVHICEGVIGFAQAIAFLTLGQTQS